MITFKAICIQGNRRKDGTHPVKIRVTFKGKTRRLPTTLVCHDKDLTRGGRIKSADILSKADRLIIRMRDIVGNLSPFDLEDADVDYIVSRIRKSERDTSFQLDFFEYADKFLKTKSESTRKAYITALNAFERFIGRRRIDINEITRPMLKEFVEDLESTPKMLRRVDGVLKPSKVKRNTGQSANRYLTNLGHIFNSAKERYNDEDERTLRIPRSPFTGIKVECSPSEGQRSLGVDLMQRIISAQTEDKGIRFALDLFVVSFGLMGANLADLYNARPFQGNTWVYRRLKTRTRRRDHAEMRVEVPEVIRPYLSRLRKGDEWWLGVLHDHKGKDSSTRYVNNNLRKWANQNGVEEFTFYASRHSFATIGRSIGIEKATIDDCLCHVGDYQVADIYAEKSWRTINEANRKILALFTWDDFTL